jgi:hypothetical protein
VSNNDNIFYLTVITSYTLFIIFYFLTSFLEYYNYYNYYYFFYNSDYYSILALFISYNVLPLINYPYTYFSVSISF